MLTVVTKLKETVGHLLSVVLPVFLSLLLLPGCDGSFDSALKKEIDASTTSPGNYLWEKIGHVATPLGGAAAALHNGILYLHGGEDASGIRSELWLINVTTGESSSYPTSYARAHHTMTVIGDNLFLFGGIDETLTETRLLVSFDTGLNWNTPITTSDTNGPFPEARSRHIAFACDGYFYVHGGALSGGGGDDSLYRLEFVTTKSSGKHVWSEVVTAEPRSGHGAALIDSKLYFAGGQNPADGTLFKNIWTYDITSGNTAVVPVDADIFQRENIALAQLNGLLYSFSGEGASGIDSLLVTGTITGESFSYDGEAAGRSEYVLESDGTSLVLFGGRNEDKSQFYNDLWIITLQ